MNTFKLTASVSRNLHRITRGLGLAVLMLATAGRLPAQDQTVTGNLTVTANTSISGYTTSTGDIEAGNISASYDNKEAGVGGNWIHFALDLGDIAYKPSSTIELFPGLNVSVAGNANVTLLPASVTFTGYSPNTTWTWAQDLYDNGAFDQGNLTTQMQLSDQGVLTLESTYYNTPSNITFDPGNQTIVFSNGLTIEKASGYLLLGLGSSGFAVGANVTANSTGGFALGNNATANATGAFALGTNVTANAVNSIAVGHYSSSIAGNATTWQSKDPAFIVGIGNSTTPANGLVVLNNGDIYSGASTSFNSTTGLPSGEGSFAAIDLANGLFIAGNIAHNTTVGYSGQVAIGFNLNIGGYGVVALGASAKATSNGAVGIGYASAATGQSGVSIGLLNNAYSNGGVAIGFSEQAYWGNGTVALGYDNSAGYTSGIGDVAIGNNDISVGNGTVAVGNTSSATGNGTVAIGNNVAVTADGAAALGSNNTVSGTGSAALGDNITITTNGTVNGTGSIALGDNLTVGTDHALVAGQWAGNGNVTISGSGGTSVLFALGNGTSNTTMSNAFTILKNGDATITGNSTLSGANTTISGNATIGGNTTNTTISGNVTLSERQGDVYMGSFTNVTADQAP